MNEGCYLTPRSERPGVPELNANRLWRQAVKLFIKYHHDYVIIITIMSNSEEKTRFFFTE